MATLLARVPLTATADVLLVATAQGAGPAGWRLGFLGSSWTGSVVLKANMAAPGQAQSLTSIPFITESTGATNSAGTAITGNGTYVVQPGYCVYDLYAVYTHTSGSAIVTVQTQDGATASGDLTAANLDGSGSQNTFGSNVPYTGAYTFPGALAITGALTGVTQATFSTKLVSSTALATPSTLAATALNAFASTVSGAVLMGYGTTNDVSLKNRAGTTVLGVGPNTTAINIPGTLAVTGTSTLTGNVGVGAASNSGVGVYVQSAALDGVAQHGVYVLPVFTSSGTTSAYAVRAKVSTAAAAYTCAEGICFLADAPTIGAASALTTQYGVYVANQGKAGVTNAYGIRIIAQSGAATLNIGLHNAGTSHLIGNVGIGKASTTTSPLCMTGIPTSAAGLAAGDVWSNSGVLTIV